MPVVEISHLVLSLHISSLKRQRAMTDTKIRTRSDGRHIESKAQPAPGRKVLVRGSIQQVGNVDPFGNYYFRPYGCGGSIWQAT